MRHIQAYENPPFWLRTESELQKWAKEYGAGRGGDILNDSTRCWAQQILRALPKDRATEIEERFGRREIAKLRWVADHADELLPYCEGSIAGRREVPNGA